MKENDIFLFAFHSFIISRLQIRLSCVFLLFLNQHTQLTGRVGSKKKKKNSTACLQAVKQVNTLQKQVQSTHACVLISKIHCVTGHGLGDGLSYSLTAAPESTAISLYHLTVDFAFPKCPLNRRQVSKFLSNLSCGSASRCAQQQNYKDAQKCFARSHMCPSKLSGDFGGGKQEEVAKA